jgi:hypothetical protein
VANQNFKVKKGLEVGTALTATSDGLNVTGVVTATQFSGDGSGLTGVTAAGSGVVVQEEGSNVGTAATINFIGSNVTATISGGVASVTVAGGGDVVTDTTPQLGGNLDLNSKDITGTGNISITGGFNATGVSTFQESVTFQSHASFGDDDKANFGAGNDLQIYHESSSNNSFIKESGSGSFFIQGSDLYLTDEDGTNMLYAANNAGVSLYYGGGKEFETTGYGATVFGTLQSQQLNVSGIATAGGGVRVPANSNIRATTDDSIVIVGDEGLRNGIQISGTTGIGVTEAYIDASGRFVSHADTGEFYLTGSSDTGGTNYFNATSTGTYVGGSQLDPGASNIFLGLGTTSHFLGNVGIGETQPTAKLDVNGNANISGTVSFGSTVTFGNDDRIRLGDNNEFDIYYSGGRSYIKSGVGQLRVKSASSMLFMYENQDGTQTESYATFSHNGAVSLFYDGDKKLETTNHGAIITGVTTATSFSGSGSSLTGLTGASAGTYGASNNTPIITVDSNGRITGIATVATAGAGGGGGISNIVEDTTPQLGGNLDLNSKDITGSGDIDYTGNLKVTGISTITGVAGFSSHVTLPDHAEIQIGNATGGDLKIYHNGSYSVIADEGTGELVISGSRIQLMNAARSEKFIDAFQDGAVNIYHNNALRLKTSGTGVNITDDLNVTGISTLNAVRIGDGGDQSTNNLFFGADNDLKIYHTGIHAFIENSTGNVYLRSNSGSSINIEPAAGASGIIANAGDSVELYYNNSKKFETTGTGAIVTGILTATSFSGDGSSLTGIAVTSQSNTQVTYNFGASGNNYVITGPGYSNTVNNPDLYLVRGQRYRFINATGSSHPLRIQSDTSGTAYTDGVSGSQSGTQEFNVQHDAPSRLFYQCTIHSGMIGNIYITGGGQWENTSVAASGTPEIYTDYAVGIGTDNPSAKLEVATSVDGEATLATFKNISGGGTNETVDIKLGLENTVASNVILRAGKEGNHSSGSAADNFFAIHTTLDNTSSEKLRISSGGKVTITSGTNSGDAPSGGDNLLIKDSDGCGISVLSGDGNSSNIYLGSQTDEDAVRLEGFYNSGSPYFNIYTAGSERLRITSGGHVRVNTGDLRVGDDTDSNAGTQTISVGSVSSGSGGIGIFANPTNGNSFVQFGDGTSSADQYRGYMNYRHSDDSLRLGTSGSDRLHIDSDGNIGVNTNSPGVQSWRSGKILDIHGGAGNVTGELHIGANRGDGVQSVGSINFYDNSQDSTHRHVALIESDKGGTTSNKRGGELAFYTKPDNVAAPAERLRITSAGIIKTPNLQGNNHREIHRQITGFSSGSSVVNYLLICETSRSNVRLAGRLFTARASGTSATSAQLFDITFQTNHDASHRSGAIMGLHSGSAGYGHAEAEFVSLTYNSTNYYAIRFRSGWTTDFDTCSFDGIRDHTGTELFTHIDSINETITNVSVLVNSSNKGDVTIQQADLRISDGDVIMASGHGISFAAATPDGSSVSSEVLDDYEEGSWTISDAEGSNTVTSNASWYVKVGSLVHIRGSVDIGTTSSTSRISLTLPFNSNNSSYYAGEGSIGYTSYTGATPRPVVENSGTRLYFYNENSTNLMTWQNFSGKRIDFSVTYQRT